jgi:hypothetical protein
LRRRASAAADGSACFIQQDVSIEASIETSKGNIPWMFQLSSRNVNELMKCSTLSDCPTMTGPGPGSESAGAGGRLTVSGNNTGPECKTLRPYRACGPGRAPAA